jgi:hypothetical protein
VESVRGVGVPWQGGALVDGKPWPVRDESVVWLPAGAHTVEPSADVAGLRIETFNGELRSARVLGDGAIELEYQSKARALAVLNRKLSTLRIDGVEKPLAMEGGKTVALPRGRHRVIFRGAETLSAGAPH